MENIEWKDPSKLINYKMILLHPKYTSICSFVSSQKSTQLKEDLLADNS